MDDNRRDKEVVFSFVAWPSLTGSVGFLVDFGFKIEEKKKEPQITQINADFNHKDMKKVLS